MSNKLRVRLSEIPALEPGHQTVRQALLLTVNTELDKLIDFDLGATEVEFDVENGTDCSLLRRQFTEKGAAVHQIDSGVVTFRPDAEISHPTDVQTLLGVLSLVVEGTDRSSLADGADDADDLDAADDSRDAGGFRGSLQTPPALSGFKPDSIPTPPNPTTDSAPPPPFIPPSTAPASESGSSGVTEEQ